MFKRPWKGRGNLSDSRIEFGNTTHVLCLGAPEQVKGLQWALDQGAPSRRAYKVYRGSLSDLPVSYSDYDFVVMLLDLGQPVPVESLQKIATKKEGLCAFIQPTPGQLLALNEASDWNAIAWDGVSVSEIAIKVDRSVENMERKINNKAFIDSARSWIRKQFHEVEELKLVNPPENWNQSVRRRLDQSIGVLSFGCRDSQADVRLLLPGSDDLCELRFYEGDWSIQGLSNKFPVEFRGDPSKIRSGDELQINNLIFCFGRNSEVDEFVGIARKLSIIGDEDSSVDNDGKSAHHSSQELENYCRSLMYRQASGELSINSDHKSGSIFFYLGDIVHATTGAVSGQKALLRIINWADVSWAYVAESLSSVPLDSMRLDLMNFTRSVQSSRKTLEKVRAYVPPAGVSLKIVPEKFMAKVQWTIPETKVLASVGEYGLVRDILNYCPLPDTEIFETLIDLRRQGLLLPVTQGRRTN